MTFDVSDVKGLAKKVFGINWAFGRVSPSRSDHGSFVIWSRQIIPKEIAKIVPSFHKIYLFDERYIGKAEEFIKQYKLKYPHEDLFQVVGLYSTPTI